MDICQWWRSHTDVAATLPASYTINYVCLCVCLHVLCYYRSEVPAQVFLLILTWLISAFGDSKRDQWKNVILAYDNMCHVDNLKVAKKELPLPGTHMLCMHHMHFNLHF